MRLLMLLLYLRGRSIKVRRLLLPKLLGAEFALDDPDEEEVDEDDTRRMLPHSASFSVKFLAQRRCCFSPE